MKGTFKKIEEKDQVSTIMCKSKTKLNVTEEKSVEEKMTCGIEEHTHLSHENVHRLIELKERQMAQFKVKTDGHRKRIAEHYHKMTEHARLISEHEKNQEIFHQISTQTETRKYRIPQIENNQKFIKDQQKIQRKIKEYEDISQQNNNDSETINHLIQEMESGNKIIVEKKVTMHQSYTIIESKSKEIEKMEEMLQLKATASANDLVELLDKIYVTQKEIETWVETGDTLEKAVCSWKEKRSLFEKKMREWNENTRRADQKTPDVVKDITNLKLRLEFEDKMNDHRERVNRSRDISGLRKQLQEELLNRFEKHKKKMENHREFFLPSFRRIEEEQKNIKSSIKAMKDKHNNIEESESRIDGDMERMLTVSNSEMDRKCSEDISYPPNKIFKIEHMKEIKDLCAKLDRSNGEYQRFEAEHDQWSKMKIDLEDRMKTVEQNIDAVESQLSSIISLKRMSDLEEKIMELNELDTELKSQIVNSDRNWAENMEKIKEFNKNNDSLTHISEKLQNLSICADKSKLSERVLKKDKHKECWKCFSKPTFGELTKRAINSDQSRIKNFRTSDFQFELVGSPSNLEICHERARISEIKKKFKDMKQRNENMSGLDNSNYRNQYLDKTKETDSCLTDIKSFLSLREKEKLMLKHLTCQDTIKNQCELIHSMEKRVRTLSFLLDPEVRMAEYRRITEIYQNQKADVENQFNRYMTSHGQKFEGFDKLTQDKKKELFKIIHENQHFTLNQKGRSQPGDILRQKWEHNEALALHEEAEITNKKEEDVVASISSMLQTAHDLHEEMKSKLPEYQKEMKLLNEDITTQYKQVQTPLCLYSTLDRRFEKKLVEINTLLESIEKLEDLVQLGLQTIQNWQDTIGKIETKAKKLAPNPFNVHLDYFNEMKKECMTMMTQQKDNASNYALKLRDYTKERNDFSDMLTQINAWISSVPSDAMQLFKEAQDSTQSKVQSSMKTISNFAEKIELGQKEVRELDSEISDVRKEMIDIEVMTENPCLFTIESMTSENITHVFSNIREWNEKYERLKKTIGDWEEKMRELEENIKQWKTVAHEKSGDKHQDSLGHPGSPFSE